MNNLQLYLTKSSDISAFYREKIKFYKEKVNNLQKKCKTYRKLTN